MQIRSRRPAEPASGPLPGDPHLSSDADLAYDGARRLPLPAVAVLIVSLVAAATLAFLPFALTPAPVPAEAPAEQFSAERAMGVLRAVAAEPRPMGSPAHEAAIATIRTELDAVGAESEIIEQVVTRADFGQVFTARVRNVIARIPGTDSTGTILLMSHFNSVPTSPAANDGGLSVVTALETARALRAGQPPRNDILLWFGDADETTALNAEVLTGHPWFGDVRLALAFEGIGMRGPSVLSFAGAGNPGGRLATQPIGGNAGVENVGSSFTTDNGRWLTEALEVLPHPLPALALNDLALGSSPDLAMSIAGTDVAGLSFTQIRDTSGYHTDLDRPDRTSPASVQSSGDSALALVRHFGDTDFAADRPQPALVAFSIFPRWTVAYPAAWSLPLAAVAALLLLAGLIVGRRRKALTLSGAAVGVVASVLAAVLAAAAAAATTVLLRPDAHFARSPYGQGWRVLVFALLAITVTSAVHLTAARLLRTAPRILGTVAGALGVLATLAVLSAATLPALSYVFVWPALFGSAALAWRVVLPAQARRPWLLTAVLVFLGAILAIVVVPVVYLLASAVILTEPVFPAIIAAFIALMGGALAPHVHVIGHPRRWVVPVGLLVTVVVVATIGILTTGFSAERPRPNHIQYALDADTGQATWLSAGTAPDTWTRQFFANGHGAERLAFSPGYYFGQEFDVITAPAPPVQLPPPRLTVLEDRSDAGLRTVTLRVTSPRGASVAHVDLALPGDLVSASVEGREQLVSKDAAVRRLPVAAYNLGEQGMEITLSVRGTEPVTGTLIDYTNGLPALPGMTVQPRPAEYMPAFFDFRDPTSVSTRVRF